MTYFLGLSVLELGPMYATDRQTSDVRHRLMPPPYGGGGIITVFNCNYGTWWLSRVTDQAYTDKADSAENGHMLPRA